MADPTYADFHVHTHLSPCAKSGATAGALLRRARDKGLVAIGFADHYTPQPVPGCAFYDRQRLDIVDALRAEIAQVDDSGDVEILVGVEADYTLAGRTCIDRETLARADYVICAASHFHLPAAPQPGEDTLQARADLMLQIATEALAVPGIAVWAHPFDCSRMRPLVPILDLLPQESLAGLIDLANARRVAIEVNGGPARLADYRQATTRFFRLACDMGARFTVTADAHHPDDLDRFDLALGWARTLGIGDGDLLTAQEMRVSRAHTPQWT